MVSLCDSDVEIRRYILAFAKECLDAWNGLAPSRGRFSYEIAAIAASNAYANARKEMRNYPEEYISKLMEPPAPWSKEQTEEEWKAYYKEHPHRWRMTAKFPFPPLPDPLLIFLWVILMPRTAGSST